MATSSPPTRGKVVREQWLRSAVDIIARELCEPNGVKLPAKLQVSVGIPHGRKGKGVHSIGQCWRPECSKGGHVEVFIHPELDEPGRVLDVLVHELIHASGIWDHGKNFKAIALRMGLEGKMTATECGPELKRRIKDWLKRLPPYLHTGLDVNHGRGDGPKKQGTRMIKVICESCGYTVRTTRKWTDVGLPTCPCGEDMIVEGEEDADEE